MKMKQYYLGCLAHASYMIMDDKSQLAAVVDPQRDIEQYLTDAEAGGYRIASVFLTHFHADFLAGHIELRDRVGAQIYLGAKAEAEYDFVPLKDGDSVDFGDVKLTALETPGHTPEGISILVYDLSVSDTHPHAVLTGDTLFIGDVGRPDLLASLGASADELAEMLYDSITQKLVTLPDDTLVYPAHGAGSLCGKNLSDETVSTIGEQKKLNYALQPMSREEFKAIVMADQPDAPDYFAYDAIKNRQERATLETTMADSVRPLELDEILRRQNQGDQILDVRDGNAFAAAHLRGALNVGLRGKYATWAGTLLDKERPIVVIAEDGDESEAIMRLGRIGFDNAVGYLNEGMRALETRPDLVARTDRVTVPEMKRLLENRTPPVVVDVRTANESEGGVMPGRINVPLNELRERVDDIPQGQPLLLHCEGGYRSAIAASLLQQAGRTNLHELVGGYRAWAIAQQPEKTGTVNGVKQATS